MRVRAVGLVNVLVAEPAGNIGDGDITRQEGTREPVAEAVGPESLRDSRAPGCPLECSQDRGVNPVSAIIVAGDQRAGRTVPDLFPEPRGYRHVAVFALLAVLERTSGNCT